MYVSELIIRCAKDFNDYDEDGSTPAEIYTGITLDDWVDFYNAAMKQLVLVRPDSHVKTVQHQLTVNNTRQAMPADSIRLIDITRNLGSGGTTPGKPIRQVDRGVLEDFNSSWHSATGETVIEFFSYDMSTPDIFWVSPKPHATTAVYVEMYHSYLFDDVDTADIATTEIEANNVFLEPLRFLMMSRAFGMDTDSTPNSSRSVQFEQSFYQALGIELQSGMAISAKGKK